MLVLQLVQLLDVLFLHPVYLLYLLIILHLLQSFSLRDLEVQLIDQPVVEFFGLFVRFLLLFFLLCIGHLEVILGFLEFDQFELREEELF